GWCAIGGGGSWLCHPLFVLLCVCKVTGTASSVPQDQEECGKDQDGEDVEDRVGQDRCSFLQPCLGVQWEQLRSSDQTVRAPEQDSHTQDQQAGDDRRGVKFTAEEGEGATTEEAFAAITQPLPQRGDHHQRHHHSGAVDRKEDRCCEDAAACCGKGEDRPEDGTGAEPRDPAGRPEHGRLGDPRPGGGVCLQAGAAGQQPCGTEPEAEDRCGAEHDQGEGCDEYDHLPVGHEQGTEGAGADTERYQHHQQAQKEDGTVQQQAGACSDRRREERGHQQCCAGAQQGEYPADECGDQSDVHIRLLRCVQCVLEGVEEHL